MKILVTGAAGFIGSALSIRLLELGEQVIGIDNHNDYYDQSLKEARLKRHESNTNYTHLRVDLADRLIIYDLFKKYKPQRVVNLAAQAGVRYSLENPLAYVDSNLVGFSHILEGCRHNGIEHLVYASSSSVYGANTSMPYSIHDNVDHPLSLYAATKKANELMAHTYSHLYNLPTTGLRFFTVYGPWGRPDMALHKFAHAIVRNESIKIFNQGKHKRDFTYIDDIVEGILRLINKIPLPLSDRVTNSQAPFKIYNIGNNNPVTLRRFISAIENACKKKANENLLPMQAGDVPITYADISDLKNDIDFQPATLIEDGISSFVNWYKSFKDIS